VSGIGCFVGSMSIFEDIDILIFDFTTSILRKLVKKINYKNNGFQNFEFFVFKMSIKNLKSKFTEKVAKLTKYTNWIFIYA